MFLESARHILELIYEDDGKSLIEYERVIIFLLITIAGFIYLSILGILAAGNTLAGPVLYLLGAAILFDMLPEIWLLRHAKHQESQVLEKLQTTHYGLEIVSYLTLGLVMFDLLPVSQFIGYSFFLLTWLIAFLVGEAVMILTGRFSEN